MHYSGVFGTCRSGFGDLFLVILVLITVGCGTLGGSGRGHGLTSRPRESASEDFLNRLLVLFGYPDRSAAALLSVFYPFGIVLPGLLVNFPLGGFLTGVMFVSWLLMVFLVLWFLMMTGLIVICCLALLVVLVVLFEGRVFGRL